MDTRRTARLTARDMIARHGYRVALGLARRYSCIKRKQKIARDPFWKEVVWWIIEDKDKEAS